uniref:Regulation of nuclear pre-mRNA domain-containing protein 1B n=2 Tax=Anthurium amnicola TaxID=1678845 RepID=A0A1D1YW22_9ARAE
MGLWVYRFRYSQLICNETSLRSMMNNIFSTQILADKLAKLNNSQQSIETLSHWCIFHRKKARQVVETWEKLLNNSPKEQRVPFLYLANDILQNSRRKGSEFVNEYWKVLPGALKSVFENGDEHGKNVVIRLVDIWDERKVFGSRSKGLKDEMFGKEAPPSMESNGKSSNFIKIVKKDAQSIRIKLAVGGMPEKIVTAFQSVHDEHLNEDAALNKFLSAVQQVGKLEKEVDEACNQGSQDRSPLVNVLQEQEDILKHYIEQLENVEAARQGLISQLKEAVQEQESKLELAHNHLSVAQTEKEHVFILKQRLTSTPIAIPSQGSKSGAGSNMNSTPTSATAETTVLEPSMPIKHPQLHPSQPVTSFASFLTAAEEQHKKAAAEVAAKLAASTSSAQMLTSVLSSLVAEEVASMNGFKAGNFTSASSFPPEKRQKLEKPLVLSDMGSTFFGQVQQQQTTPIPLTLTPPSGASIQPISQSYPPQPPLPPPPPPIPPPPQVQQYVQTSNTMGSVVPYGYGSNPVPPPPLPSSMPMSIARPSTQPLLQQKQHDQPIATSFYQSPGIGFYGQPSTAPVPRQ